MQTITINEQTIAALTAAGWKRWSKADKDRMYLNTIPTLEVEHYNTGNVRSAEFDGQRISNADARRLMGSKVYIDLATGELHVDTQYYSNPNYGHGRNLADVVAEHVAGILATVEDEQVAEVADDGTEAITDTTMSAIANLMDRDIAEQVHSELAPCTNEAFIVRYCELHPGFEEILDMEFSIDLCDLR